jgi:hypothetical protein
MFVELAASALLLVPGICYACDSLTIENSTTRTVIQRNQGCLVKENASQRQELQDLRKRLREVEKDRDDSKEREKRWQEDAEKPPVSWNAWTVRGFSSLEKFLDASEQVLLRDGFTVPPRTPGGWTMWGRRHSDATVVWVVCNQVGLIAAVIVASNGHGRPEVDDIAAKTAHALDSEPR